MDCETDISFKKAAEVFDEHGIEYQIKDGGHMMWVAYGDKVFAYYPTTHRWAPRHLRGKHYRASSTKDFVERFVLKGEEDQKAYREYLKVNYNLIDDKAVFDLVDLVYEMFEDGIGVGQIRSDVNKMLWARFRNEQ